MIISACFTIVDYNLLDYTQIQDGLFLNSLWITEP